LISNALCLSCMFVATLSFFFQMRHALTQNEQKILRANHTNEDSRPGAQKRERDENHHREERERT